MACPKSSRVPGLAFAVLSAALTPPSSFLSSGALSPLRLWEFKDIKSEPYFLDPCATTVAFSHSSEPWQPYQTSLWLAIALGEIELVAIEQLHRHSLLEEHVCHPQNLTLTFALRRLWPFCTSLAWNSQCFWEVHWIYLVSSRQKA